MATPSLRSLEKALDLLGRIVESGELHSISDIAKQIKMPHSTAYRIAARRVLLSTPVLRKIIRSNATKSNPMSYMGQRTPKAIQ